MKCKYRQVKKNSEDPGYMNRVLIATPTTGLVRMEWVMARYGQIIPMNWSQVQMIQFMNPFVPQGYAVADAQNVIVKEFLEKDFQWLWLIEHDNILPEDATLKMNRYMREAKYPVISGLYYSKSQPAEPMVFRGRGTSVYDKFKLGDLVWCDGVPTGCLLIHKSILKVMWDESAEYMAGDTKTRRVFDTPRKLWFDPESHQYNATTGTSDLEWCTRVMEEGFFVKAGWPELQKKKYPFLVDTGMLVRHITQEGQIFP